MDKFKVGDIVNIVTTGERGCVYIVELNQHGKPCYRVHLPRLIKDGGIDHEQIAVFWEPELESDKEKIEREFGTQVFEFQLREEWHKRTKKAQAEMELDAAFEGTLLN